MDASGERIGASEAENFQRMVDTFLIWRDDINHSDPEQAIRFGFLIVACVLRDLIIFDRMRLMRPILAVDDERLKQELPKAVSTVPGTSRLESQIG